MAKVFLSYDRDDTERARPVAVALEKAGHSVWWDLHIRGGAQFSKAIEQALGDADVVIVLWSANSVESAWVRDEAAAGRDSGRLIPASLDETAAPLGFRQFQTIDLTGWKGRGAPPHLGELLDSINALAAEGPDLPASPVRISKKTPYLSKKLALAAAASVAVAGAAFMLMRLPTGGDVQTIAVVASEPAAKPLARELLVNLGSLQSAKSGSMRLLGDEGGSVPKADLIFQAAGDPGSGQPSADLLLLSGKDKSLVWSKNFQQASGSLADLKQQMAFTAARVLGCALKAHETPGHELRQQTLKTYLNACAQLSDIGATDASAVVAGLLQVTKDAPWFKGGWAKLLVAQSQSISPLGGTDQQARQRLLQYIESARRVDPAMPQIPLAEVAELGRTQYARAAKLLDRAKNKHPDDPDVLTTRSFFLMNVGRMREAVEDSGHAAKLDPLSPLVRNQYISTLMYAGNVDQARAELNAAERLWPDTASVKDIKLRFNLRYGDPKVAMSLLGGDTGPILDLYLRAKSDPTPENVQRATSYLPANFIHDNVRLSNLAQSMAEFHREDALFAMLLQPTHRQDLPNFGGVFFRPGFKRAREDSRFMRVAKAAGLVDYWQQSGRWPDFCFEPRLSYDCKAEAAKLTAMAS